MDRIYTKKRNADEKHVASVLPKDLYGKLLVRCEELGTSRSKYIQTLIERDIKSSNPDVTYKR